MKFILVTLFSLHIFSSYAQEKTGDTLSDEKMELETTNEEVVDALTFEKNITWYEEVGLLEEAHHYMEENLREEWEEDNTAKADKNLYGSNRADQKKNALIAFALASQSPLGPN